MLFVSLSSGHGLLSLAYNSALAINKIFMERERWKVCCLTDVGRQEGHHDNNYDRQHVYWELFIPNSQAFVW